MSIWSDSLDAIYATIGVDASIVKGSGGAAITGLTVIDKTAGVAVDTGNQINVQTVIPACVIRASELTLKSMARADLIDSKVTFNGKTWRSRSNQPKPQPDGEDGGELYLFLTDENL